ncbi:glucan endo-1,3-beta-glucosidase isoform X3 [Cinnamomum micranthum f. kanehirae]|uniref:Glucan endo-1,3-beta-glucosidase isoform X3 n=1 Tax=Cinnamomum micranthum f. kanehirae TaxID=337451 RepID=A0A443N3H2_9MAGN|nr:glucan endo-1,3-beta-glucosidase isoform X3 [Cinnamomum micranthum f. kanehirae]
MSLSTSPYRQPHALSLTLPLDSEGNLSICPESHWNHPHTFLLLALFRGQRYCHYQLTMTGLGLYYGRQTSNSPSAAQVVKMFKENGYSKMWISQADDDLLNALNNQGIKVILGIPNSMIKGFSSDVYAASNWVKNNISSHQSVSFTHVCVGDLSNMSPEDGMDLIQAMENLYAALKRQSNIKVSTLVDNSSFASKYDIGTFPSKCQFSSKNLFREILKFLKEKDSPLFIKAMPYFEMDNIPISIKANDDNFLLNDNAAIFLTDQDNTEYKFVFDAMVDSFFGAMKDLGYENTKIVVASGWPRESKAGDTKATVQNAKTYNSNLKSHIETGTPKNKNSIETFIWSAFDEDRLAGVHEGWKHLGAFVFGWNNLTLP